ncbi:MAG: hypothetical protein HOJ48_14685 [Desulfobacula sp.]|jgi:hypothetical protein|nr:hypothetical protein [Desulfobacula sp.]
MKKISVFYLAVLYLSLSFILFPSVNAHAYLDPGTGSMILQTLLASFMIIGTGIGIFRNKLKIFFKRLFNKEKKNNTL